MLVIIAHSRIPSVLWAFRLSIKDGWSRGLKISRWVVFLGQILRFIVIVIAKFLRLALPSRNFKITRLPSHPFIRSISWLRGATALRLALQLVPSCRLGIMLQVGSTSQRFVPRYAFQPRLSLLPHLSLKTFGILCFYLRDNTLSMILWVPNVINRRPSLRITYSLFNLLQALEII